MKRILQHFNVYQPQNDYVKKEHLTRSLLESEKCRHPFEISTQLAVHGLEAILQDDLESPFQLNKPPFLSHPGVKSHVFLKVLYFLGVGIRYGFLLPLRACFMLISIAFLIFSSTFCIIIRAPQSYFSYCGITFARLFNISTGLLVTSENPQYRPKTNGLAVSNHLSANDVMTIYSDCLYSGKGYTITSQVHGGIVGLLLKYGGMLTPILLVEREKKEKRNALLEAIKRHCKSNEDSKYPILLFPEGYCTNNTGVIQFRKSAFNTNTTIFPIALRQNSDAGDAYWQESTYFPYLLRIWTSWALHVHIKYLPPMHKKYSESDESFASRVQQEIATAAGIRYIPYPGVLKRKEEREKYKEGLKKCISGILMK